MWFHILKFLNIFSHGLAQFFQLHLHNSLYLSRYNFFDQDKFTIRKFIMGNSCEENNCTNQDIKQNTLGPLEMYKRKISVNVATTMRFITVHR